MVSASHEAMEKLLWGHVGDVMIVAVFKVGEVFPLYIAAQEGNTKIIVLLVMEDKV